MAWASDLRAVFRGCGADKPTEYSREVSLIRETRSHAYFEHCHLRIMQELFGAFDSLFEYISMRAQSRSLLIEPSEVVEIHFGYFGKDQER